MRIGASHIDTACLRRAKPVAPAWIGEGPDELPPIAPYPRPVLLAIYALLIVGLGGFWVGLYYSLMWLLSRLVGAL